ncbi:MAG: FtsX-like permease family protein, partial [Butyricicoccus sp.]
MQTFHEVYAALRRKNWAQYRLLTSCCFFSVLLITAYVTMMRSPTILHVLPEGGDSRKQVMMIFVLACVGCAVFTTYASAIFFRQKSREMGVFLLLGATRKQICKLLFADLARIAAISCVSGALLGAPLAWGIWVLFRLFVVDSEEMPLTFDAQAYLFALIFSIFVVGMLFGMGIRFIRRTNIIDVVNTSHKTEPIREVKAWYGIVGIFLMGLGGLLGYLMPSFFVRVLRWYAPGWIDGIFYVPLFIGLYMVLLHTVVNGFQKGKSRYRHLISTAMMKFQGRQTVRNMLVITVLLAGAYFGLF